MDTAYKSPVKSGRLHRLTLFVGATTRTVPLPKQGTFRIGAAMECELALPDCGLWPVHAVLELTSQGTRLCHAAGQSAPIWVNGRRLADQWQLVTGDSIQLGNSIDAAEGVTLVYSGTPGLHTPHAQLNTEEFRRRLADEVERGMRTDRPVAVLCILLEHSDGDALAHALDCVEHSIRSVDLLGVVGGPEILVCLTDTGAAAAQAGQRVIQCLQRNEVSARAGFTISPDDSSDPDALIAGAREACQNSPPGEVRGLEQAARRDLVGTTRLVSADPAMRRLLDLVRRLAPTSLPVLILGETGVGKDVLAQAVHYWSSRSHGPFVAINCASISPSLFETELFGHTKGAFTGATDAKKGLLESAAGGTVFLDEIGECPPNSQAKLLRAIESRSVTRVGSVTERTIDVRIVAATNSDLQARVAQGLFRPDLFFRLNAALVEVPALRDRPLDIGVLARHFLAGVRTSSPQSPQSISPSAMRRLTLHDWPGNVRELRNVIEFAAATGATGTLRALDLPPSIASKAAPWLTRQNIEPAPPGSNLGDSPFERFDLRRFTTLKEELQALERTRMAEALESVGGVQNRAAELLGMPLRTFVSKMQQYGLGAARRGTAPKAGADS